MVILRRTVTAVVGNQSTETRCPCWFLDQAWCARQAILSPRSPLHSADGKWPCALAIDPQTMFRASTTHLCSIENTARLTTREGNRFTVMAQLTTVDDIPHNCRKLSGKSGNRTCHMHINLTRILLTITLRKIKHSIRRNTPADDRKEPRLPLHMNCGHGQSSAFGYFGKMLEGALVLGFVVPPPATVS